MTLPDPDPPRAEEVQPCGHPGTSVAGGTAQHCRWCEDLAALHNALALANETSAVLSDRYEALTARWLDALRRLAEATGRDFAEVVAEEKERNG